MSTIGGVMAGGSSPLDGEIVDLRAVVTPAGIDLSWRHVGASVDFAGYLAVAIDGDLVAVLPAGSTSYSLALLGDGEHRVEVVPLRADVRRPYDLHGHAYGRRAYLLWPASTSEDCRSYVVYGDEATGTVDYDNPIATISGTIVATLVAEIPTTGTGTGRVSVSGLWQAGATNRVVSIEVGPSSTFRHDVSGDWSAYQGFTQGSSFDLDGVRVSFDSPTSFYEDEDVYSVRVGPVPFFATALLAEGTHKFAITATDEAGNESDPLDEVEVAIIYAPDPVTNLTASWDGTDITLAWTLPGDDDLNAILVYSNFSNTFLALADAIIETGPYAVLSSVATSYTITPSDDGTWRFYVRTRDAEGRVSESVAMIEVDTLGLPTGTQLNTPENVIVTPTVGGTFRITWNYATEDGGDLAAFAVYANEDEDAPVFSSPVATISATASGEYGVLTLSYDTDSFEATQWFTVRARTSGSVETTNVDLHEGVPDDEAPSLTGEMNAVPN